ncbi:MAG: nucleoside triphosphate pyrophosphohydrolase [Alphaproteobacteria bacterium]|nr:nucleoside triphosphate pyrophosphohydrolase [Alphaproteobacteria bacterium]
MTGDRKDSLNSLLEIMARLRDPEKGCPWDRSQTAESISGFTLEEAYEVYDAVALNDMNALREELGDLLFHIVFYAQIAKEQGLFDFFDIAQTACDKMIRRHPHIFGKAETAPDWEEMKRQERSDHHQTGILSGIAKALPAATRAYKLQSRAARVGFDWDKPDLVLDKIVEESAELRAEIAQKEHISEREDEMGDLLFACVNLARKLNIDPEKALKRTNAKFERRFSHIEEVLKSRCQPFEQTNLEEMEALWTEAKHMEKKHSA